VPVTCKFCIRNTGAVSNGFALLASNDYSGELFYCDILPKHPNSTTPYDKSTAYVDGDDIRVHGPVQEGDKLWVAGSSLSFTEGDTVYLGTAQALTAVGDGTGADKYAWKFMVLETVSSASYVQLRALGVGEVPTTS
jgi:hypothetical protein